jgi:hypothetical protein
MSAYNSSSTSLWLLPSGFSSCVPAASLQITFAVTSKDKKEGGPSRSDALRSVLSVVWPYLLWLAAFAAGVCFFVVKACMEAYGPCEWKCQLQCAARLCPGMVAYDGAVLQAGKWKSGFKHLPLP